MKISCIQMDMQFANPEANLKKAEELIRKNAKDNDVLVLPETWNTGFFPKENLEKYVDDNGQKVKNIIGKLAKELNVNIIAGSVANKKSDGIYNTSYIFDREGKVVGEYDKSHLFTPMGEDNYFNFGEKNCTFELDGVKCGIIICYDLRFPEFIRNMSVEGLDALFMVAQWPDVRVEQLMTLVGARAIENQMYVVCCNSCGTDGTTKFGGNSAILSPLGETLIKAGENEEIIESEIDLSVLEDIRSAINVFKDRRPELYKIK